MALPLFNTSAPLAAIDAEIRAKVAAILDSGVYVLGPEVKAFEAEFASYIGAREAIGVANGTDALVLALRALGVGPGDEVIVPSFTFYASAEAIPHTGARPVFCDIDPETMLDHARDRARGDDAAHEGRDRRPPVRQRRPGRGDRGARRPGDRGRRAGRRHEAHRRPPPGSAGHDRDVLVLPLQEPRRVRRRRRGHHQRSRPGRDRPHAALPRLARQAALRAGRLQLAPRRAAGGHPARPAAAPRRAGRTAAAPPRRPTPTRASASSSRCPSRRPAPSRPGICTSSAASAPTTCSPPSRTRGSARARTTASRPTCSRRCASGARGWTSPAPRRPHARISPCRSAPC